MFKKYFKISCAILLLMATAMCSHQTFRKSVYPGTGFYALKVFATLNTINENFIPNSGVTHTDISLKSSSFVHYIGKTKHEWYQTEKTSGYTYLVKVDGNALKAPLSVAALALEYNNGGTEGRGFTQKISTDTMSLLTTTNTTYSSLAGGHINGMPGPVNNHKFIIPVTGELPKINATITNGVFYPKSIGITNPLSPVSLAYYPEGAFQGNIPSYLVDAQGQIQTRLSSANPNAIMNVFGSYVPQDDKVTGTIEYGDYKYGTFTIQDVSKETSLLSFEIFSNPQHK
ncbi:MAG TPA: hypothetical protein VJB34_03635 [Bdellovibrionota bacterium]|nr:hypothetical protein [Bdellovibrionota bacterium]